MKAKRFVISIIGSYSLKNRGDELLLKGTIELLWLLFKDRTVKFNIYLMKPNEEAWLLSDDESKNIDIFSSIITRGRERVMALRSLYLLAWSYLYRVFRSSSLLMLLPRNDRNKVLALLQSDLIVYRSIDQISDIFSSKMFLSNYIQVIFCYNLKKRRLLLHSQTIYFAKSHNLLSKFVIKFLITRLSKQVKITLRDRFSEEWFIKNGVKYFSLIPPPSIMVTHGILKENHTKEKCEKSNRILIAPRILSLKGGEYVELIGSLLSKHPALEIYLAGQSYVTEFGDDDYVEIRNILHQTNANRSGRTKVFDIRNKSILDILRSIMNFDCVVSERAFMAVSALSLGVPSIILDPYGGKSIGLARLFGFEKFACPSESSNTSLIISWIENILENKEQYSMFLKRKAEELYNESVIKTRGLIQASQ